MSGANTPLHGSERRRVSALFFYLVLVLLVYLLYRVFAPFLVPFAWAAVIVVFAHPWHARVEKRFGPTLAAAVSTATATLVLIVPALLVTAAAVREAIDAGRNLQTVISSERLYWFENVWLWIGAHWPGDGSPDLAVLADEGSKRIFGFLASRTGAAVQNAALFVLDLAITLFATFFFFRDGHVYVELLKRSLPFERSLCDSVLAQARDLVFATITSGLIVATVQGLLGGLAFAVVGIGAPIFWGVVMAFFCLLPLGAWVVWGPAAIWLIATGQVARGLILSGIGIAVVSAVDNFLRPALLSGRSRMNGLMIFVGLLGGLGAFGAIGLVLGPVLVATGAALLEAYTGKE